MTVTSTLIKIARKFELKLVLAQTNEEFKKSKLEQIKKDVGDSLLKIHRLLEKEPLQELTTTIPARLSAISSDFDTFLNKDKEISDPEGFPLRLESAQALKKLVILKSISEGLYANLSDSSISTIVEGCLEAIKILNELAATSGRDTLNQFRKNWADIANIFGNYYRMSGAFGDESLLDQWKQREIDSKIGNATGDLSSITEHYESIKKALDVASKQGLLNKSQSEALSESDLITADTSRLVKNLTNNQITTFMQVTELAPPGQELSFYNEFIRPYQDMVELVRLTFNSPPFRRSRYAEASEEARAYTRSHPSVVARVNIIRDHIQTALAERNKRESERIEKLFGTSPPMEQTPHLVKTIESIIKNIEGRFKNFLISKGHLVAITNKYNELSKNLDNEDKKLLSEEVKEKLNELEAMYEENASDFRTGFASKDSITSFIFE